jgi:Fe-S-cluster containining protein
LKLPCDKCGSRCCTLPAMNKLEFKKIKKHLPSGARVTEHNGMYVLASRNSEKCPLLSKKGKCNVYHIRPSVCRLYGQSPALPCMFLYPEEAVRKMEALNSYKELMANGGCDLETILDQFKEIGIDAKTFRELRTF